MAGDMGDTVFSENRYRAGIGGGEVHLVAPFAHAVTAAAVGAHLHGVVGGGIEPCQLEGVGGGINGMGLVVVDTDLPCGGRAVLGPAQFHTVGIGFPSGESCGGRASNVGGESDGIRLGAHAVTAAVALHLGFVFGFSRQAGKGGVGGGRMGHDRLPCSSIQYVTQRNVINGDTITVIICHFKTNLAIGGIRTSRKHFVYFSPSTMRFGSGKYLVPLTAIYAVIDTEFINVRAVFTIDVP